MVLDGFADGLSIDVWLLWYVMRAGMVQWWCRDGALLHARVVVDLSDQSIWCGDGAVMVARY